MHHPAALRLMNTAQADNAEQRAWPRKKKMRPKDPNSPGQRISKIRKEREALQDFYDYMKEHIDHSTESEWTPLNPNTVLKAAIKKILVGEGMHYSQLGFYQPPHDKNEHVVLQIEIDLNKKDSKGRTNRMLMKQGKAPHGPDGRSINLHHVTQRDTGPFIELTKSTHNRWHRYLHHDLTPGQSQIDRINFSKFRNNYWKWRIQKIEDTETNAMAPRKISFTEAEEEEEEHPVVLKQPKISDIDDV